MKLKNSIIITNDVDEVIELHELIGDIKFKNCFEGNYPTPKKFYDGEWYWVYNIDGFWKGLSGSSGYHAGKSKWDKFPTYPIYTLKGYKNYIKK